MHLFGNGQLVVSRKSTSQKELDTISTSLQILIAGCCSHSLILPSSLHVKCHLATYA